MDSPFQWHFAPDLVLKDAEQAWLAQQVSTELTPNLSVKHTLFEATFQGVEYIIKRYSPSDNKRWSRKIEMLLKSFYYSGAERSFLGSLKLRAAGLPTMEPIAWCVYGKGLRQISYFIYKKSSADGDLEAFLDSQLVNQHKKCQAIERMGQLTRQLHDANLRHVDIISKNFLVTSFCDDIPQLVIIDTDQVYSSVITRNYQPLKRFFDLHCLRRIRFKSSFFHAFLDGYTGRKRATFPFYQWRFWVLGGFNPSKRRRLMKQLTAYTEQVHSDFHQYS